MVTACPVSCLPAPTVDGQRPHEAPWAAAVPLPVPRAREGRRPNAPRQNGSDSAMHEAPSFFRSTWARTPVILTSTAQSHDSLLARKPTCFRPLSPETRRCWTAVDARRQRAAAPPLREALPPDPNVHRDLAHPRRRGACSGSLAPSFFAAASKEWLRPGETTHEKGGRHPFPSSDVLEHIGHPHPVSLEASTEMPATAPNASGSILGAQLRGPGTTAWRDALFGPGSSTPGRGSTNRHPRSAFYPREVESVSSLDTGGPTRVDRPLHAPRSVQSAAPLLPRVLSKDDGGERPIKKNTSPSPRPPLNRIY